MPEFDSQATRKGLYLHCNASLLLISTERLTEDQGHPVSPCSQREASTRQVQLEVCCAARWFLVMFICAYSSAQLLEPFRLNPEAYNPLRFHPNNTDQRHPYAYIPFSAGSHNCIGQNFAFKEERLVISSLVSRFHISLDEEKGRIQQRRYWLSQNPL